MDGWMVALFVPTLAFLCVVAPVWIFMHYRSKQRAQSELTEQEREELVLLSRQAEGMLDRIDTLEAILDSETRGWRNKPGQEYQARSR